jgi:hypothetical protein
MAKSPPIVAHVAPLLLLFFGVAITGCGAKLMSAPNARVMQGIQVTPASADAQKFPGGQVQFTATVTFTAAPTTMTSPAVLWSIGNPFATPTPMPATSSPISSGTPSVSANGLAQCNGFVGIVSIQATAPADPSVPISQMNSMTMVVSGTAQMICP